jgi:DNA-binding LytR/AlgR family response regulator
MKVIIIEDEQVAVRRLEKLLQEINPEIEVICSLDSVETSVEWLGNNPIPDLIFMDIQLADGSSFEIFEHIKIEIPVIFITAFDEYAVQAFRVNAIDYLLKPLKMVELAAAIEKYTKRTNPNISDYTAAIDTLRKRDGQQYLRRMLIRFGQNIKLIDMDDVAYFYTKDKITFLVSKSTGKRFPIDYSLDKLEIMLNLKVFFRINRQFIVNIASIKEMHTYSKSRVKIDIEPPTELETIVSTDRSSEFKKWLVGE